MVKTKEITVSETEIAVADHAEKLGTLATSFGYEGALTVGALEDEIRFYQRRTVESSLDLGKRLILLKEMTPHGEFKQRVEKLNINERAAQRFMSAALKFSKTDNLSLLKAAGNQTKLLELLVLDDEEIEVLSNGGSVNELTLDDIDRMTASELRKALRSERSDKEALEQFVKSKDEKLTKLDLENTKLKSPAAIKKREETLKQQMSVAAIKETHEACLTMMNATSRFTNDINSVVDTIQEHGLYDDVQDQFETAVIATFQRIAQISVELGIQIDFENMLYPDWMQVNGLESSAVDLDGFIEPETGMEQ